MAEGISFKTIYEDIVKEVTETVQQTKAKYPKWEEPSLDLSDYPALTRVSHNGQLWAMGHEVKGNETMMIFGLFHEDDVVRAYCLQSGDIPQSKVQGPTRYTLDRRSSFVLVETMSLDVFKSEMAAELLAHVGFESPEDDVEDPEQLEALRQKVNGEQNAEA